MYRSSRSSGVHRIASRRLLRVVLVASELSCSLATRNLQYQSVQSAMTEVDLRCIHIARPLNNRFSKGLLECVILPNRLGDFVMVREAFLNPLADKAFDIII